MKLIVKMMIVFSLFFVACHRNTSSKIVSSDKNTIYNFPADWIGYWEGNLEIFNAIGMVQEIPMSLEINSIPDKQDQYSWTIVYGDNAKGERAYLLKVIDSNKGQYVIDENNGILLDAFLFGNNLVSTYEVANNLLDVKYTLENDHICFDIIMSSTQDIKLTGDTIINNDTIPEVKS